MTAARLTLDDVVAIDFHAHALNSATAPEDAAAKKIKADQADRWKSDLVNIDLDGTAQYYRERKMMAVIFGVDSERHMGDKRVPNIEVAEAAARHDDVFVPFASIDPYRGKAAIAEAVDLIENHGVQGFKFHPSVQDFAPDDRLACDLYEVIAGYKRIALFHSGQTGIGRNFPGGGGVRLKYSNPMYYDDLAVDFPDMTIVIAHPSFPWQDEALAVARHKQNVFIDLSGWSPKYFDPKLIQHSNNLLKDKVLFGSDFPLLTPDRWLADFAQAPFKDEVRSLILKDNAVRVLGLR
ncbi:MAG: 4-hydroxyphenyl-beta-ketoacyl-CoA hydrolase [Microbacterium sp. 67-17]|uniref:amidohydrolase family protein n=1 Tax=Microbacterium sp. 67-17 TaxID=1895782 RepID=UPI00095C99E0|nr:amidohydrolase family protein [Microbacterium sp. 67-17]OJW02597.1 MAG: 4-hydroxyphenyl-beta-ketoacyl-CoA hydrolase [Microbacterium sp. 67-17]